MVGYVIMPNHIHAVISFNDNGQSINTRIGNGKRFLAYGIVERLQKQGEEKVLIGLQSGVNNTDRERGKRHQVFKACFDCKECVTEKMLLTKLRYMHDNPCRGNWQLADTTIEYPHSSAKYYYTGEQGLYPVTGYLELQDMEDKTEKIK